MRNAAQGSSFLNVPVSGIIVAILVGVGGRFVGTEGAAVAPDALWVTLMVLHFSPLLAANFLKYNIDTYMWVFNTPKTLL